MRILGRGGFGTVYAAQSQVNGSPSAVKVARADALGACEQLLKEAQVLQAIGPRYAPAVYASGLASDGAAYAALELIGAQTLAQAMVEENLPFTLPAFGAYSEAMLAAVEAVHQHGFTHCDLKPENIFIEGSPLRARLLDFGLARAPEAPTPSDEKTGDGAGPGSADYMSPEQCRNSSNIGFGADIYSLGVMFFEMLTGRVPFFGKAADVQEAHRSHRPPPLSEIVPVAQGLEEVILRCLAKEPEQRFNNVAALRTALHSALNGAGNALRSKKPKAAARVPRTAREKRPVALLFFTSSKNAADVPSALASFGGQLAHAAGNSYVSVFGHESGDNPAARALAAAKGLIGRGLTDRLLIELATVTVQARPEGGRRYFSPIFTRADRYPAPSDAEGIFLTDNAAKAIKDLPSSSLRPHRGMFQLRTSGDDETSESLIMRQGGAPLVGRDEILESLVGGTRAATHSRQPTIATVIAEPGHGKSRLGAALVNELKTMPGAQLLTLRAREPSGADADQTIRELLSKLLRIQGGQRSLGAGRSLLAERLGAGIANEVWPGVALALGWLSLDAPELRPFAAAPGALRAAAAKAAGLAMRQWAEQAPLLFVLDDAQFADEATLDAIEYATLAEGKAPIWACVLARPTFEAGRPSWSERCEKRHFVRVGPLTEEAASALCRALLSPAQDVPAAAIQLLVDRTHGVPLQIVELVRALKSGGLVRQNARTGTWYLATDELGAVPDLPLVEWLAARELESLPPELASHGRLAALLGAEFTAAEIAGVLAELERDGAAGAFPLDASVGTQRLVAGGILVASRGERLSFRHALVRDAVYKSVPESMRRPIHQAAFRFYHEHSTLSDHHRLSRLAFHAAQSGVRAIASQSFFALAERAQSRHAYLEAEWMYSQALEQMGSEVNARRLSALRGRGLMRYRLGRYEDACKDFELGREMARALGDVTAEVEILLDEATALDWADEYRKSKELVEQADSLASERKSPLIEARLLMGLGRSCVRFNQYEKAAELYRETARKAEALGDAAYETYVISLLHNGYVLAALGRLDESERAFECVIPLCESRGDKLHLGAAVGNRFMLWTCRNDDDRLLADLHRLLSISREMGNGRMEQQAHFYLGLYLRWLNELAEAERHARRAMEIDERRLGEAARPESALLLGRVLAAQGKAAQTQGILDEIRARQARAHARGDREFQLLPSEEVFFAMLELVARDGAEGEWQALQERAKTCLAGQDFIELVEMRALAAQRRGDTEAALRAFAEAVALATQVPNVMLKRLEQARAFLQSAPG